MTTPWKRFKQAARLEEPDQVPVALIVDSPWLAGYAGIHTVDYFLYPDLWFDIHYSLRARFPDAVWTPDYWVEYGMAIEPSAFGVRMHWHDNRPPSLEPVTTSLAHWADAPLPDVHEDGLMPLALRLYRRVEERLRAEGEGIKMVAARGPMVTASWVMGVSDLMTGLVENPKEIHRFLDTITELIIRWLHAQLDVLHEPEAIMLLDDLVGMISLEHYNEFVAHHLERIFSEFEGLVRVYHNDMPCLHLFEAFCATGMDVLNFSHEIDIKEAKDIVGHRIALMGNVPPLHVGVRESPEVVAKWAQNNLDRAAPGGGMILSVGGGVSPGTPAENLDALLETARTWVPPEDPEAVPALKFLPDEGEGRRERPRRRKFRRAA